MINKNFEKLLPLIQIISLSMSIAYSQVFLKLPEGADTYFIMNIGQYIFENGFPRIDPFTIHENLHLVAQQWLSGISFWVAYKFFEIDGLKFMDFIFGTTLILIHWRLCYFVSNGNKFLSLALSFIVGMLTSSMILPRPQIFSTLFLLIEVFLLEKFTRTKNFKFLLPLPILSVLLVNFHAAMWLMSLILCLPFFFVKDTRHAKFLLATMVAIFLFGLINPYGLDAMTYVFNSYGVDLITKSVPEMATPTAHKISGKIFYLSEALIIFSLAKFKVPWRYVFLSGGITLMAIMNLRSLILFYFLATFPLACALRKFKFEKFFEKLLFFLLLVINTAMIAKIFKVGLENFPLSIKILFFTCILFLLYNLLIVKFEGQILHSAVIPQKSLSFFMIALIIIGIFSTKLDINKKKSDEIYTNAIKFLLRSEQPEDISLYVNQSYGGLVGMFGIKYYIDSRSEVFLTANSGQKNILKEYLDFKFGKIYYKDFFARYKFTHIITDDEDYFLYDLLNRDKDFRVIYESEHIKSSKVIHCKIFAPKNED